jgi:hypothetical protein
MEQRRQSQLQSSSHRSKKRKKSRTVTETDIIGEQQERYDRLFYTAHKQVRKQAKQVKNFLVQKAVRNQKPSGGGDKVLQWKNLDLDIVTQQALRQLGLYHCNPDLKLVADDNDDSGANESDTEDKGDDGTAKSPQRTKPLAQIPTQKTMIPTLLSPDDPNLAMVNDILTHKRFLQTMEDWNAKVTEYRQWCLSLEEKRDRSKEFHAESTNRRNLKRKRQKTGPKGPLAAGESLSKGNSTLNENLAQDPSAMFCTLGDTAGGPQDGSGWENSDEKPTKRNRMGQRARKAKAMAIQAKLEGRTDYVSQNWRAPKANKHDDNDNSGDDVNHKDTNHNRKSPSSTRERRQAEISRSINTNDNAKQKQASEAVHASWAAKQAQKTGIVAFQGKKITFD